MAWKRNWSWPNQTTGYLGNEFMSTQSFHTNLVFNRQSLYVSKKCLCATWLTNSNKKEAWCRRSRTVLEHASWSWKLLIARQKLAHAKSWVERHLTISRENQWSFTKQPKLHQIIKILAWMTLNWNQCQISLNTIKFHPYLQKRRIRSKKMKKM